jgi:hypothetical protein
MDHRREFVREANRETSPTKHSSNHCELSAPRRRPMDLPSRLPQVRAHWPNRDVVKLTPELCELTRQQTQTWLLAVARLLGPSTRSMPSNLPAASIVYSLR